MATTKNRIKYGLENVWFSKFENGTYSTPIHMEGAVSISLKPSGDSATIYADNTTYGSMETNNGYTGSLELEIVPDEFKTDILGETVDNNGVISECSDNHGSYFALMFQFLGDSYAKRHVLYRCKATRPNIESETTKDKADNKTESLDLTCYPSMNSGYLYHKVKASIDNTPEHATIYNSWFDQVYDGTGLDILNVTSVAGSTTGKTALTVSPSLASGDSYTYKTGITVDFPTFGDICTGSGYTVWDGNTDITATTGNEILVIEVDSNGKAIKAGKTKVISK